jgi:hypothetical protein
MPVVSSSYSLQHTQKDGRRYVNETHILNAGDPIKIEYLAVIGANYADIMNNRIPLLNQQLSDTESETNLNEVLQ